MAAHQAEVLVVALHLQAVMLVLCGVVQAVVGARAGDEDVRSPPGQEAVEQLAVIVLQQAPCSAACMLPSRAAIA